MRALVVLVPREFTLLQVFPSLLPLPLCQALDGPLLLEAGRGNPQEGRGGQAVRHQWILPMNARALPKMVVAMGLRGRCLRTQYVRVICRTLGTRCRSQAGQALPGYRLDFQLYLEKQDLRKEGMLVVLVPRVSL